jgi:hypothetical protein
MEIHILFVLRIIWLILFGTSIAIVAYYQNKIPFWEKITIIGIVISLFISIFFCCLKNAKSNEVMTPTALEEFKIDL